jgi:hypothetical protein
MLTHKKTGMESPRSPRTTGGMTSMGAGSVFRRVLFGVLAGVLAPAAFLGVVASSAFAAPTGIFAVFAQCPTAFPGVALCQYVEASGGEMVVGGLRIPVDRPIVIQGGAIPTGGPNFNEYFVLPAADGESVSLQNWKSLEDSRACSVVRASGRTGTIPGGTVRTIRAPGSGVGPAAG